ncbi:MAG TPA: TraB/GumN family protein [Phycisphaerales bacterium]|nr:TraB/GumN family protein [Phycisphaerales bacterium]
MDKSELPENVHLIEQDGREIYLVGTAHVSAKSAELVESVVREIKPDSVAVELCPGRYRALKNPDEWKNTDILQVVKQGKTYLLLAQLLLSGFQKKIGQKLGVKPGLEMLKAVEVAEELGAETVLADREVSITLKRTWGGLGFWGGMKMLVTLLADGFGGSEELDEEEIERLKTADVLEEAMQDFAKALPTVRESLIDERDKYLASKIKSAPGDRVVAVVGAGHVPGITKYIHDQIDLAPLETVPPPSIWAKVIGWGVPLLIIGLIIYGAFTAGSDVGTQMVFDWIWVNAVFGGLGTLLAAAHPLTILVSFVVSPITSANPAIAAGWVAGLVEASIRKPRVEDFESLSGEPLTLRLVYKNRVTRVLLVVILTNLLGGLGTFLSGGLIASRLA